jgi:hypothetical protein
MKLESHNIVTWLALSFLPYQPEQSIELHQKIAKGPEEIELI